MRSDLRLAILTLLLLPAARSLFACSCAMPAIEHEITVATVMFVGTATNTSILDSLKTDEMLATVTFEVHQAWKERLPRTLTVTTTRSGPECGYLPPIGGQYLVFAYRTDDDSRLSVTLCSNHRPYLCAIPLLPKLGRAAVRYKRLPGLKGIGSDRKPLLRHEVSFHCGEYPKLLPGADLNLPSGVTISFSAVVLRNGRIRDLELALECQPAAIARCTDELRARVRTTIESWRFQPAELHGRPVAMRVTNSYLPMAK